MAARGGSHPCPRVTTITSPAFAYALPPRHMLTAAFSTASQVSGASSGASAVPRGASQRLSRAAAEHRPDHRDGRLLTSEAFYHNQ